MTPPEDEDVVARLMREGREREATALEVYNALQDHGEARASALHAADVALDHAVALVGDALRRRLPVNLTECARRAGVTKQTLYSRLPADLIADRPRLTVTPDAGDDAAASARKRSS